MQKLSISALVCVVMLVGCSTIDSVETTDLVRDSDCQVNHSIERKAIPQTPNNMSLPSFGQGVIGWATGPEGAKARLENVKQSDIQIFKDKGTTLEMVQEWQAFYENEVKRNPCNPTAPYRAQLMKKIAMLWLESSTL